MANFIITIFDRLILRAPFRNEKAGYFLMHDKDTGEVSAVPESAILSKVNSRIDSVIYPDGFTKTGTVNRVGNDVSIEALAYEWRLDLNPYSNTDAFAITLEATASPVLKRVDTLAVTANNTIVYYKGEEDEFILKPTQLPTNELRLTDLTVFGNEIQDHTDPVVSEIYTLAEKEKLAALDPAVSKIYERGEVQVFKKKLKTDPSYLSGQQPGDYCIGFVLNDNDELEFINADYLGGDVTLKSSYDI